MKKFILTLSISILFLFNSEKTFAQYGVELNYGLNGIFVPANSSFSHFGGGVTYDFNETFGAKIDFGSDKFRFDNVTFGKETGTDITRISLQGVVNVTNMINDRALYDVFNLNVHAGGGYTMVKSTIYEGNDNIANVILGVAPSFKVTEGLYFVVDASLIFNISQHYNFDGTSTYENTTVNSITGIMYNLTGGLKYKFNNY